MGKTALALFFVAAIHTTVPFARTVADDPKMIESWYAEFHQVQPKLTRLRLYSHDTLSGNNPTSVPVARVPFPNRSTILFSLVVVFDNPLTEGPQQSSRPVGRAQGLYAFCWAGISGPVHVKMNFVFTNKKYYGSTLSILGRNATLEAYCEMPIVSGSGIFRLARGAAMATTHSFNATTNDVVVECNIIAMHY